MSKEQIFKEKNKVLGLDDTKHQICTFSALRTSWASSLVFNVLVK